MKTLITFLSLLLGSTAFFGCVHRPEVIPQAGDYSPWISTNIQVGDWVKVTFPGATNLNTTQEIRTDGLIRLGQHGNLMVVGKTGRELESDILRLVGPDLVTKEVSVQVNAGAYPVFVTGAVARPGKIMTSRSPTVLEAIMEAGGFDMTRADLRKVQIIRQQEGLQKRFELNLRNTLEEPKSQAFYLHPSDIVYVPERILVF